MVDKILVDLPELLDPGLNFLEAVLVCDVVHQDCAVGISKITAIFIKYS